MHLIYSYIYTVNKSHLYFSTNVCIDTVVYECNQKKANKTISHKFIFLHSGSQQSISNQ